jgi:hypothetical protein
MLLVALPLVVADLAVKEAVGTPDWAYHQRTLGWAVLCCSLLVALALLVRLPAQFLPVSAGVLSGGVIGNGLSAAWNGLAVPNPLVIERSTSIVAFNLADIWILSGIAAVILVVGTWLVRNRHLLPARRRSGSETGDPMTEETRTVF